MQHSSVTLGEDRLMNEIEAAHYLALSHRTLQTWRVKGGGPRFMRLGSAVRYRRSDLEAWLSGRHLTSTSTAAAMR